MFCPQCIYAFCLDLKTKSDSFSLYSNNLSVFITEAENIYCAVRTGSLNQIQFRPSRVNIKCGDTLEGFTLPKGVQDGSLPRSGSHGTDFLEG